MAEYKKTFNTVPHDWLIKLLQLVKVSNDIITAIEALTRTWTTKAKLQMSNSTIETEHIDYRRGILQGHGLNVILFALSVNPATFLMQKLEGYEIGDVNTKKNHP